jgi:CRISPR system Cascade subunit CasD
MNTLVLRFDAPLVSFGGPMVDHNGVIQKFPGLSLLTGLIANALGWDRREHERLEGLQGSLRYAARVDRRGEAIVEYQTVDLGAPWMRPELAGWTTRGRIAERGGASSEGTHQRYRHFRADSIHTVVLGVGDDGPVGMRDIAEALREPARPLFIGRKCCLPAEPILVGEMDAGSLLGSLAAAPRVTRGDQGWLPATWWHDEDTAAAVGESRVVAVTDEREWRSSVHVGRRLMREGHVDPPGAVRA